MKSQHFISGIVITSLLAIVRAPVLAQEGSDRDRDGFRVGLDLGVGMVERTLVDAAFDDTNFYAGFLGGYWISEHLLAGLELNGWLSQASNLNDPTVGEGISQIFLFAQLYPSTKHSWFIKAGAGYASYWNHRPGEPTGDSGEGFQLGAGYDFAIRKRKSWAISPFISYGSGELGDDRYKAFTVGAGVSYDF